MTSGYARGCCSGQDWDQLFRKCTLWWKRNERVLTLLSLLAMQCNASSTWYLRQLKPFCDLVVVDMLCASPRKSNDGRTSLVTRDKVHARQYGGCDDVQSPEMRSSTHLRCDGALTLCACVATAEAVHHPVHLSVPFGCISGSQTPILLMEERNTLRLAVF